MSEVHKFYIKGHEILVDRDKLDLITKHKWYINGSTKKGFYLQTNITKNNKKTGLLFHRYLMNAKEGEIIDHINRNTFDNRLSNLRICTYKGNACNRTRKQNGSSKYIGVDIQILKDQINKSNVIYRSRIKDNGKTISLGRFTDEIEAAKAYNEAAIKYHGEFANLNKFE